MPKQTALFFPGMLCDHRLWQPILPWVAPLVDIRPMDIAHTDDIRAHAASLVPQVEEGALLVGLSMGGYVALELMRQLLEAGQAGRVRGLVLVATSPFADTSEQTKSREGLIKLARMGKFKGVTPRLMPTLIHPSRVEEPSITKTVLDMAEDIGLEAFIRQETAVMNRRDQTDILPRIPCPTLIMVGDGDQRTPPPCSEKMAALIPGAEFHMLQTCGHLPPLELPEETGRLMRSFIENQ
jgi:pimeloyl-ACP methyl ester carboxylesterase